MTCEDFDGDLRAQARAPRRARWPGATTWLTRPIAAAFSAEIDVAGEQHFHGVLARDVARQRHHRRRAEQADVDARRGEAGLGRGDGEIAACDELAAGGGGDALHRRDHRLRQVDDLLHHRAAGRHDLAEIGAAAVGIGAARGEFLEIVAGAERRAVRGQHDRAHRLVRRDRRRALRRARAAAPSDRLLRAAGRLSVSTATGPSICSRSSTVSARRCGRSGCSSRPLALWLDSAIVSDLGRRASAARGQGVRRNGAGAQETGDERAEQLERFLAAEFPQAFHPTSGLTIEEVWHGGGRVRQAYQPQFIRPAARSPGRP